MKMMMNSPSRERRSGRSLELQRLSHWSEADDCLTVRRFTILCLFDSRSNANVLLKSAVLSNRSFGADPLASQSLEYRLIMAELNEDYSHLCSQS